jgi:hypothetical protein
MAYLTKAREILGVGAVFNLLKPMQRTAWGKLRLSQNGIETAQLPLVHHCADVAAVVEALLLKGLFRVGWRA